MKSEVPLARPPVIARGFDNAGPDGIQLDAAKAVEVVAILLCDADFEAPLEQGAATRKGMVETADVPSTEKLHGFW